MKNYRINIDLDGTLCGYSEWYSFLKNTLGLFKTGLDSSMLYGIKYNILTARPKIDLPFIYLVFFRYGKVPPRVISQPSLFYEFKNKEDSIFWKSEILKRQCKEFKTVFYVDDDPEVINRISSLCNYNKNLFICNKKTLKSKFREEIMMNE